MIATLLVWHALAVGVMPDRFHLTRLADSAGVPAAAVLAIAWQETRANLDPKVRGAAGERGRFQIKPGTAARRCRGLDIRTYRGNVQCFLSMFKEDMHRLGVVGAIRAHNGRGHGTEPYVREVLATMCVMECRSLKGDAQ